MHWHQFSDFHYNLWPAISSVYIKIASTMNYEIDLALDCPTIKCDARLWRKIKMH